MSAAQPSIPSEIESSPLYNRDLAPAGRERQTWGTYNFAALWVSMSVNILTYMLAAGLVQGGMNWKQALATVFLGNSIVLIPMLLNSHPGARYGIPFPVLARASFGGIRRQCGGSFTSPGGVRLVWNSNLDWWRSHPYVDSNPGSGVGTFALWPGDLLCGVLADQSIRYSEGH